MKGDQFQNRSVKKVTNVLQKKGKTQVMKIKMEECNRHGKRSSKVLKPCLIGI